MESKALITPDQLKIKAINHFLNSLDDNPSELVEFIYFMERIYSDLDLEMKETTEIHVDVAHVNYSLYSLYSDLKAIQKAELESNTEKS